MTKKNQTVILFIIFNLKYNYLINTPEIILLALHHRL